MKLLRRLFGAIVLLLSSVGFTCFVAGIAGCWLIQQEAARKVETISTNLDAALQRLSAADERVADALTKAHADVNWLNKELAGLGAGEEKNGRATDRLATFLQQQAGPKLYELAGRLSLFSEEARAVSSLLRSLQELGLGRGSRLDADDLDRTATRASQLSALLQTIQDALREGDLPAVQKTVVAATKEVDLVLQKCEQTVAEWQSDLDNARTEHVQLKTRLLGWLLLATIGVTVVLAWLGLSQLSLFAHGWKWCWGS